VLEQQTSAYAVLPDTQWRGYRAPLKAPAPRRAPCGVEPAPMPSVLAQAAAETGDLLARALASLGRAFMARDW